MAAGPVGDRALATHLETIVEHETGHLEEQSRIILLLCSIDPTFTV